MMQQSLRFIKFRYNRVLAVALFATIMLLICSSAAKSQQSESSPANSDNDSVVTTADKFPSMGYLENDRLKLGVDLRLGGAITLLVDKKYDDANMINSCDWGRQVQLSFYSGPHPYEPGGVKPVPRWAGLGWNPIQSGDVGGFRSRVTAYRNDGKTIFVRCIPMHWPHKNVPGECTFECTYSLKGNMVDVVAALNNDRPDRTQYPACGQEMPAVYTNGPWYKLVTYIGDRPYEGAPLRTVVDREDGKGWPWRRFYATERWAALVNDKNIGLGVYQPDACDFSGGFHGGDANKGHGGPKDGQAGYIAPLTRQILDYNIRYEYQYVLIAGSVEEIRDNAYHLAKKQPRPKYTFEDDRQDWTHRGVTDAGWPMKGEWKINLSSGRQGQLIGPETFWQAADAPILEIEAAFQTEAKSVTIVVEPFDQKQDMGDYAQWGDVQRRPGRTERLTVPLEIQGDGKYRTYRVDLSKVKRYRGPMVRLNLLLPDADGKVRIRRIEMTKSPK